MGSYLTIVNNTDDIYSVKIGPDTAALMIGTLVAGAVATVISAGAFSGVLAGTIVTVGAGISVGSAITSTSFGIHAALRKDGYITLNPGERHKSQKMSLSLWQQCEAIRTRQEGNNCIVDKVMMRPIFTGATDGSNNDHEIRWWRDKHGHTEISRHTFKN
jgi:hypothetical protein